MDSVHGGAMCELYHKTCGRYDKNNKDMRLIGGGVRRQQVFVPALWVEQTDILPKTKENNMKCKKWIALLLAVVMVVGLTACGEKDDKDNVVAKVDSAEISASKLDAFVTLSAYLAGQDISAFEEQPEVLQYLKKNMLVNLVAFEAMRLTLEKKNAEVFPADYKEKLNDFLEQSKADMGRLGLDEAAMTYYFNISYYSKPFNDEANALVSDADVKAYYEEHIADQFTTTAPRAEVKHILASDEKAANEAYDKIKGGADFGEMAKEYGTDGTKDNGGSLGVLLADDANYDADFMKAAFQLKSGEVSKPVKTQFGYHIIKLENREEGGVVIPFDEEKDTIRNDLVSTSYNKIVTELVSQFKVEYLGDYAEEPASAGDDSEDTGDGGE